MSSELESSVIYSKLIEENYEKGFQLRVAVTEFREVIYFQLRKYFLSSEGEWIPSREGVSMPASFSNVENVMDALLDLLSQAEGEELIEKYYKRICQAKE